MKRFDVQSKDILEALVMVVVVVVGTSTKYLNE